jgi:hypothetical protein
MHKAGEWKWSGIAKPVDRGGNEATSPDKASGYVMRDPPVHRRIQDDEPETIEDVVRRHAEDERKPS